MFATTCSACGHKVTLDESRIPLSGLVMRCPHCANEMAVLPPGRPANSGTSHAPQREPDIIDLPAPKLKSRPPDISDLLVPVGAEPRQREVPDLLAPVGPAPRRQQAPVPRAPTGPAPAPGRTSDLFPTTPAVPTPPVEAPDLLAPVGPAPVRNAPDLLTPVGPAPTRGLSDLPTPVGPVPIRNAPDLLTPVGPAAVRAAPDLLAPVGSVPTKSVDALAPRGFFDEAPLPRGARAAQPPAPLDELDVIRPEAEPIDIIPAEPEPTYTFESEPIGLLEPGSSLKPGVGNRASAPELDLAPPPELIALRTSPSASAGFSLDDIQLPPEEPAQPAESIELGTSQSDAEAIPLPEDEAAGIVSFSTPRGRAATTARPTGRDHVELPDVRPGMIVPAERPTSRPARKPKATARKPRAAFFAALAAAALLAAGYEIYTTVEFTLFGFMTEPARERRDQLRRGTDKTRRMLHESDVGHWYRAAGVADRVLVLEPNTTELKALAAQAYLAATFDEGLHARRDREQADALITDILKAGEQHVELEKAQALRKLLDASKAGEAYATLTALAKAAPTDPEIPLYMGWAAQQTRSWDKAKEAFTLALKLVPDRQAALVGLGGALRALGDGIKARETLQRVFDKYPEHKHYGAWLGLVELANPPHDPSGMRERELAVLCETARERETAHPRDRARALTLYGDEALAAGRYDQAADRYRQAREFDEQNLDAMVGGAIATIELRSHSPAAANLSLAEARRALEATLAVDPRQVRALVGLTRVNLAEKKPAEARKAIDAALAIAERDPSVHYWRGKVLEVPAQNAVAEAEKEYQRAIELAPDDYATYIALSQLYTARAQAAEKSAAKSDAKTYREKAVAMLAPLAEAAVDDKLMANILGSAYLGAHDTEQAAKWFRAALTQDPQFTDARLNLAAALDAQGRMAEAISEYTEAYAQSKREDIALALALAHERARAYPAADSVYKNLLAPAGSPPSPRVLAAAGRFYARRDDVDTARKLGELLSTIAPTDPAALFLTAVGQLADGKLNEAQRALQDAIAYDAQAQYFELAGRIAEKARAYTEAQVAFGQALRLDATYVPALLGLGRIHLLRREWAAAIQVLGDAARIDPAAEEIWLGMGDAYFELRDLPAAVSAYEQALARNDKRAETYYRLGKAAYEANDARQTVARLKQAIERAPADTSWLPDAWRRLGFRYRDSGQQGEMCAAFKQYLALAPSTDIMRAEVKRSRASCPE